MYAPVCSSILI